MIDGRLDGLWSVLVEVLSAPAVAVAAVDVVAVAVVVELVVVEAELLPKNIQVFKIENILKERFVSTNIQNSAKFMFSIVD